MSIIRNIIRPLAEIQRSMQMLANGDMENGITPSLRALAVGRMDESGQMARSFIQMAEMFIEKIFWYESLLDSIPFPISVTDMNMNWTFINKPVEGLLKVGRKDVVGHQCSEWNANICKTENCGIARLRKNFLQTFFDQFGGNFKVDTSYIYNTKGEKVGHIEVVQDITTMTSSSRYAEKAVQQLAGYLTVMANGSLNYKIEDLPPANQNSEETRKNFLLILDSLRQARNKLRETIRTVSENAQKVGSASEQLADAATQASRATTEIASTLQQIAKGAAQQNEAVNTLNKAMDEIQGTASRVASGIDSQSKAVDKANNVSSRVSSADGISVRVSRSAEKVQEMGTRSEQIGMIVETIQDIASQTNMLALNAAIEAARAGEHGKGFAVVADEVRKLAERSGSAAKEITQLVKGIQSSVDTAVVESSSAAQDLNGASTDLIDAITSVSRVVEENASASVNLSRVANTAMQSMEMVASVGEENSASVEEVSASTEEMSAQVEEVTASSQSLAEMAHLLRQSVEQFQF